MEVEGAEGENYYHRFRCLGACQLEEPERMKLETTLVPCLYTEVIRPISLTEQSSGGKQESAQKEAHQIRPS